MKTDFLNRTTKFFRYTLLTGGILYIAAYLTIVFLRIQYPFELEWEEGAAVDHVLRILSGQKYYVSPSLEFVPSIYTPLFFYVSAAVSVITGAGFIPLRLVSFISSLGSFLIIYLIVKRETGNTFSGIIASCLFAATFRLSGSWFDVGRVDSLFLFFLLTALYLVKFSTSGKSYILAGVFISLSFLTKQTALVISLPLILYCILSNQRPAFFFIGTTIAIIGLSNLFLNYMHDGWYNYYVFELPRTTPISKRPLFFFWSTDIKKPLFIAVSISIFYMLSQFSNSNKKNILFYFLAASGMLAGVWFSRYRGGGGSNVLLPAYAIISILFGLGFHTFLEFIKSLQENKRNLLEIFIYLACIVQFSSESLIYNPLSQIPTQKDLEAGREFIDKVAQIKGEVFVPYHGYLPLLAGKKSYAHQMGMRDVLKTRSKQHAIIKNKLIDEIKEAMRGKRFSAIIIDSVEPWYPPDMEKYYVRQEKIFEDETVFLPVTGMQTRPEYIYIPQKQ